MNDFFWGVLSGQVHLVERRIETIDPIARFYLFGIEEDFLAEEFTHLFPAEVRTPSQEELFQNTRVTIKQEA